MNTLLSPAGRRFVEGLRDGRIRPPAMMGLMPADVVEVGAGLVALVARPEPRHDNGVGMAHGGWAMTLLDTAMGLAAQTQLEDGRTCVTADLAVRFHQPVRAGDGPLRIVARTLVATPRTVTTTAVVESAGGAIHASATAAFAVIASPRG
jgi:uncharacterized protein (TIGR00369 family)